MSDTIAIHRKTFEAIAEVAYEGAIHEAQDCMTGPKGKAEYQRLGDWVIHLRDCKEPNCNHESHGTVNIPEPWEVPMFQ